MQRGPMQEIFLRLLWDRPLEGALTAQTSPSADERSEEPPFEDPLERDPDEGSGWACRDPLSNRITVAARLLNLFSDRDRRGEDDDQQGCMRLFRSCGEGHVDMNKELFERLELGESLDIEDLLLLTTLMGQQQDPNATTNLLTTVILAKCLGRPGCGRGIETALLLTQFMNASTQAAGGATGVQPLPQNNMLPLLLALMIGRGEEGEAFRALGRRRWREKEEFPEPPAAEKRARQ